MQRLPKTGSLAITLHNNMSPKKMDVKLTLPSPNKESNSSKGSMRSKRRLSEREPLVRSTWELTKKTPLTRSPSRF